jgi:hypothetical protein
MKGIKFFIRSAGGNGARAARPRVTKMKGIKLFIRSAGSPLERGLLAREFLK